MEQTKELLKKIYAITEELRGKSDCIIRWLDCIGDSDIVIDWPAGDFRLYGKSMLASRQNGYISEKWNNSWLVIADSNADPFIYDKREGKIFFSRHGEGKWHVTQITENFSQLAEVLYLYAKIFYCDFSGDILDSECEVKIDFVDKIKESIFSILNKQNANNFIDALIG